MEEILININDEDWELMKNGEKTLVIRTKRPKNIVYPFRVLVYTPESKKVVGKFDCDATISTIKPEEFVVGSCMTLEQIRFHADGKPICAWNIKKNSVFEYDMPFSLEDATGRIKPPSSWCYLNRDAEHE